MSIDPGRETQRPTDANGQKNIYVCDKCFGHIVTVDLVPGTTPFMIACRATEGCHGKMQSSFYRVFDQRMRASHEWYMPDANERATLSLAARKHVERGGLLLREVAKQ